MKIDLGKMGKWKVVTAEYYGKDREWYPVDLPENPIDDTLVLCNYNFCVDCESPEYRWIYFHGDGRYTPSERVCRLRIKAMV